GDARRVEQGSSSSASDDAVRARLELTVEDLDLPCPPTAVHLRFLEERTGWAIFMWSSPGGAEILGGWIRSLGDVTLRRSPLHDSRVTVAEVRELPGACGRLAKTLHVEMLILRPSGEVSLAVSGGRRELHDLIQWIQPGGDGVVRNVTRVANGDSQAEGRDGQLLTQRQQDALREASERGYYDVPRKLRLRELADALDTSPAALSELLRRAEKGLIEAYLDGRLTPGELDPMTDEDL
ncbi:MAG: helix-turn-helix domain-containing protein, partial [Candidatus Thermoplasmatota archaeon]|nr:helix-turn-helix domain-containing protein [Candidatus Thermoplasmatota archaeon]